MIYGSGAMPAGMPMWLSWMMAQVPNAAQTMPGAGQSAEVAPLWQGFQQQMQDGFADFIKGTHIYQTAEHKREVVAAPIIWQDGTTRLLDYGVFGDVEGPGVLVIPSLINHSYILDLEEEHSLLRYLAHQGLRPFLVDWGELGAEERDFNLEDYIVKRIEPALQLVQAATNKPVSVMGYCMGGVLATALASQHPNMASLVLMATPWDFHVEQEWMGLFIQQSSPFIDTIIDIYHEMPVEMIQMCFTCMNPSQVVKKFAMLSQDAGNLALVKNFIAVEDWVQDCIPLAPKVAKECLFGWYRDNLPSRNQWQIKHTPIIPSNIKIPTLSVIGANDTVVPRGSAESLSNALVDNKFCTVPLGHVGLVTSRDAPNKVWQPIAEFIHTKYQQ